MLGYIRSKFKPKLIVLFAAANPENTSNLNLGKELGIIKSIQEVFDKKNRFKIETSTSVTLDQFEDAVLKLKPDIIHFSGHSDSEGICLIGKSGIKEQVSGERLFNLFTTKSNVAPHCIILNSCYSLEQAKSLASVVSYVIAMDGRIFDKDAIAFSEGFYKLLFSNQASIKDSYSFGITKMNDSGLSDYFEERFQFRTLDINPPKEKNNPHLLIGKSEKKLPYIVNTHLKTRLLANILLALIVSSALIFSVIPLPYEVKLIKPVGTITVPTESENEYFSAIKQVRKTVTVTFRPFTYKGYFTVKFAWRNNNVGKTTCKKYEVYKSIFVYLPFWKSQREVEEVDC